MSTIELVRRFIEFVLERPGSSLAELEYILDELALSYHTTPTAEPSDVDRDPPGYPPGLYQEVGKRFPELGYFAVADPAVVVDEEPVTSDAVDDLSDIVRDLLEVLWRYENIGLDDAHWHFRLLHDIHWGQHLRELQLYLHVTLHQ